MAYFSFGKKAHKQLTQMITIIIIIISLNGLCFIRFSILSPLHPPDNRHLAGQTHFGSLCRQPDVTTCVFNSLSFVVLFLLLFAGQTELRLWAGRHYNNGYMRLHIPQFAQLILFTVHSSNQGTPIQLVRSSRYRGLFKSIQSPPISVTVRNLNRIQMLF